MKHIIFKIISALAVYSGVNALIGFFLRKKLFVYIFHSVSNPATSAELHGELYSHLSVPIDVFEKEIAFLKASGHTFITFRDLLNPAFDVRNSPKPTIIYFDDGYVDNLKNALPVLKKYGAKGVTFVVSGFIDRTSMMWSLEYRHFLKGQGVPQGEHAGRIALLKSKNRKEREAAIAAEYAAAGFVSANVPRTMFMNWEEVAELARAGFEIGSHTVSHPKLSECSEGEVLAELVDSKKRIETVLGNVPGALPVVSLSYPHGRSNPAVERVLEKAGYHFAVSKGDGLNDICQNYAGKATVFKKIPVTIHDTLTVFKARTYFWNIFSK